MLSLGHNLIGVVGTCTGWVPSDVLDQPAQLRVLEAVDMTFFNPPAEDSPAVDAGLPLFADGFEQP